jgi:phage baseplate assembly protein W
MQGIGPKLPLAPNDIDGAGFGLVKTVAEEIQQNLTHIILTSPGERIMDIDFGVGLRRFLFEQMMPQTEEKIEARIYSQVNQYMPFVKIEKIEFFKNEFLNLLSVSLTYNVPSISEKDILLLEL